MIPALYSILYFLSMREAVVIAFSPAQEAIGLYPELERIIFVQFSQGAQQVYEEAASRLEIVTSA